MSKESRTNFFTPVCNTVFANKQFTTRARQVLLILELKAGKSRIAKISNADIRDATGYPIRGIKRTLGTLESQGWIVQEEAGVIRLPRPVPKQKYAQVFESVVFHPQWEDWQKHILLFLLSQYRGKSGDQSLYALNLYGRKAPSIETTCKIPGSTKQRRERLTEFVDQLQSNGILRIVNRATSNRPAICAISRDEIEKISPDPLRYQTPVIRHIATPCHTSRSRGTTRHVAGGHPSRSKGTTRHVAEIPPVTYVKEPKREKDAGKIPWNPPKPPQAAGGRFHRDEAEEDLTQSDSQEADDSLLEEHGIVEFLDAMDSSESDFLNEVPVPEEEESLIEKEDDAGEVSDILRFAFSGPEVESHHELGSGDSLAQRLPKESWRRLIQEVEERTRHSLKPSKARHGKLAEILGLLLESLPDEVTPDDFVSAIQSPKFDSLNSKSWGLLLSKDYITRLHELVLRPVEDRTEIQRQTDESIRSSFDCLRAGNPADQSAAIENLMLFKDADPEIIPGIATWFAEAASAVEPAARIAAARALELNADEIPLPLKERLQTKLSESDEEGVKYMLEALEL